MLVLSAIRPDYTDIQTTMVPVSLCDMRSMLVGLYYSSIRSNGNGEFTIEAHGSAIDKAAELEDYGMEIIDSDEWIECEGGWINGLQQRGYYECSVTFRVQAPEFAPGDSVHITSGDYAGRVGEIDLLDFYDPAEQTYAVWFPSLQETAPVLVEHVTRFIVVINESTPDPIGF